ncbi:hypothetical protein S1361_38255 [Streptomyces cyanogenus]|uniref:Uncharacterized protein n=1 Tax=Streptomyces cyanogenus TaxID=80860 RepID=A0ABX7TJJ6_STRCY|nr:hypothetical protein S1361_00245 [Streptomyces cyanogenus]QTE03242.1 hypothetical protein S1361_38255 [Streptomyces cyanogenus]
MAGEGCLQLSLQGAGQVRALGVLEGAVLAGPRPLHQRVRAVAGVASALIAAGGGTALAIPRRRTRQAV